MEPKTKHQRKVVGLSSQLPEITEIQKACAYEKCLIKWGVRSRKTLYCLECGHSWKNEQYLVTSITGCLCPNCNNKIKLLQVYSRYYKDYEYYSILDVKEDMQVVRMFYVQKFCKKRQPAKYFFQEVMQHWIDENGKYITLSKKYNGLGNYNNAWVWDSGIEVRTETYTSGQRNNVPSFCTYPKGKILPILKRNGINFKFHQIPPHLLMKTVLSDRRAETLLKTGQGNLLKYYMGGSSGIHRYWSSVKICIRNRYIIKDASMWFDYLKLLEYFKRDIHNAFYICPVNLKKSHDRLVKKKRDEQNRKRIAELRLKLKEDQEEYVKLRGMFFGLRITEGNLLVKPIESVEECMNEGDILKHCVFTNEYYKKKESLILSARLNNKPIETIEVSLEHLKVVQSRGMNNHPSPYHEKIVDLVHNNIKEIAKKLKTKKHVQRKSDLQPIG